MLNSKIEKNNRTFESLSNHQKRVEICKDVIKHIKSKKLKALSGRLMLVDDKYLHLIGSDEDEDNSCQPILNKATQCSVCGKGALLFSYVDKHNNFTIHDLRRASYELDREDCYPKDLLEIFGRELLDDIELSFENTLFSWHYLSEEYDETIFYISSKSYYPDNKQKSLAKHFVKYKNLDERLIAIMENIIENNGELVVSENQ